MIGDIVKVIVDRPLGSQHPQYKETYYPINYGFVEGIMAEEEEQDAYILGVDVPVKEFVGKIIAIIHRDDDIEEKWVVVPLNKSYTKEEIKRIYALLNIHPPKAITSKTISDFFMVSECKVKGERCYLLIEEIL